MVVPFSGSPIPCQTCDRNGYPVPIHTSSPFPSPGMISQSYAAAGCPYRLRLPLHRHVMGPDKNWTSPYPLSYPSVSCCRPAYIRFPAHHSYPQSAASHLGLRMPSLPSDHGVPGGMRQHHRLCLFDTAFSNTYIDVVLGIVTSTDQAPPHTGSSAIPWWGSLPPL